jgi:hypothetical protein
MAVIEISRRQWWQEMTGVLMAGAGLELLIVVIDLVIGARDGAFMAGDAFAHLARIRCILDHGFNNDDPFVAGHFFYPIYHTNLIHALYVVCAQITRCDLLGVWFDSLPWGKLLLYSGTYYFVWSVFRSRWVAWAATMFTVGVRGPFLYVIYPNQLCPYYFTPLMLAFVVQACRGPCRWREVLQIGAASLIIGQVHGLYVLFCLMAIGPVLGAVSIGRLVRRSPDRLLMFAACAAMFVGLPFILVSKWQTPQVNTAPVTEAASIQDTVYFARVGPKWVMRNPQDLVNTLGGGVVASIAWLVGIAVAVAGRHRGRAAIVLAVALVAVAIFYLPPLCTFFVIRLGEDWVMQRFDYVWGVCHLVLVAGSIAALIEAVVRSGWIRPIVSLSAVWLGYASAGHTPPDTWQIALGTAKMDRKDRVGYVETLQGLSRFFKEHIPTGQTVLTDAATGIGLTAMGDFHVVAPGRAGNGEPDWHQRLRDLSVMLDPATAWPLRLELLRRYDVSYFYPTKPPLDWTTNHIEQWWQLGQQKRMIIKLKLAD